MNILKVVITLLCVSPTISLPMFILRQFGPPFASVIDKRISLRFQYISNFGHSIYSEKNLKFSLKGASQNTDFLLIMNLKDKFTSGKKPVPEPIYDTFKRASRNANKTAEFPREINRLLVVSQNLEEIISICSMHAHDFNHVNIATAMHRIAKVAGMKERKLAATIQPVIKKLTNKAIKLQSQFRSQSIANLLWAFATLGMEPSEALVRAMSRRATLISVEFKSQEIANFFWAFATLRLPADTELLDCMSKRAVSVSGDFSSQATASLLWALATLDVLVKFRFDSDSDRDSDGPAGVGTRTILEVLGPSHFIRTVGQRHGEGRREGGATRLRQRLLTLAGWRVAAVRHWEWEAAARRGAAAERKYLERLLRLASVSSAQFADLLLPVSPPRPSPPPPPPPPQEQPEDEQGAGTGR